MRRTSSSSWPRTASGSSSPARWVVGLAPGRAWTRLDAPGRALTRSPRRSFDPPPPRRRPPGRPAQVRLWPAWKCLSRGNGPSHPGTPTLLLVAVSRRPLTSCTGCWQSRARTAPPRTATTRARHSSRRRRGAGAKKRATTATMCEKTPPNTCPKKWLLSCFFALPMHFVCFRASDHGHRRQASNTTRRSAAGRGYVRVISEPTDLPTSEP